VDGCVENTYYGNSLAVSQLGGCNGYLNINVSSSKILGYYKIWIKEQGKGNLNKKTVASQIYVLELLMVFIVSVIICVHVIINFF
jgi:hypothetical protein